MKLGIYLNSQQPESDDPARRFAEMVEQVRLARSLGFDSIWAGEHHVTPGFHFYPQFGLLQRLAADAEGMWMGTNVTLLPLHNPIEVAEVGAFLDVITGGKFLLGVGLGYRPEEYEMYRVPMSERVSRFNEGVEIIAKLWGGDKVTHQGRHWQFTNATIRPRPMQKPRPPIIIGAQVEAAIKRAATTGDGWLLVPIPTLDQVKPQMALFKSARSAAKLPPSPHICRLLEVGCAADEETAYRQVAPHLIEKYKAYFSWGLEGLKLDPNATPDQQFRSLAVNRFAVGTPQQVADMLVAQHALGITHLSMRMSWPGMGQKETLASIELVGRKVLPEVRRRTKAAA
ncbi:MAG TPA: LLM class flavin-dependent oxidoreductase [Hyphomicrobiaceae bacterium]|jgi:alkanesulfonate monooxygenase SsuD/methylene tetrahydromethanopterin reductase-like flavin-dependent oxidoreductase (luciferase family)